MLRGAVLALAAAATGAHAQTLDPLIPTAVSVTGNILLQSAQSPIELGLGRSSQGRRLQADPAAGNSTCGQVSSWPGATPYVGTPDGNAIARQYCLGTGQTPGAIIPGPSPSTGPTPTASPGPNRTSTRALLYQTYTGTGVPLRFYGQCKSQVDTNQAICNFVFDQGAINALTLLKGSLGTDTFVAASVSLGDSVVTSITGFTSRQTHPFQPVLVKVASSGATATLPKINFWATYVSSAPGSTTPKYFYLEDLTVSYASLFP